MRAPNLIFLNISTYALSSTVLPLADGHGADRGVELAAGGEARLCGVQHPGRPQGDEGHVARTLSGHVRPRKSPACFTAPAMITA